MIQTYTCARGEVIIEEIPGFVCFANMTDEARSHSMLIDKRVVAQLVHDGAWVLKNTAHAKK